MLTAGTAELSSLAGSISGSDVFTVNYLCGMYSEGCRKNSEGCGVRVGVHTSISDRVDFVG